MYKRILFGVDLQPTIDQKGVFRAEVEGTNFYGEGETFAEALADLEHVVNLAIKDGRQQED
jgi:hypothetical protein